MPDAPAPHEAHRRLAIHHESTFVLESREGPERLARYSFVGFDPAGTIQLDADGLHVTGGLPAPSRDQDPLEYLRRVQAFYLVDDGWGSSGGGSPAGRREGSPVPADHESPFVGGLVGSLGYGFARLVEPTLPTGEETWPRFLFGLYLDGLVYDHVESTVHYVSRGQDRRQALADALATDPGPAGLAVGPLAATTDQAAYEAQVKEAQRLIRAGECFQIVLSRAYEGEHTGSLADMYAWLREAAAVPYLYHLRFPGGQELLGASPEMLVRVRNGRAETFPIAGTRPVTGDETADAAAGEDLRRDRKENAEHAMLVDLARNDLGRVCTPGTVTVEALAELHRFRDVQHLVSRVVGDLEPGRDALDALAAVFPAGTVSGAPKVRAMEHIHAIEGRERGAYAGAVAYVSFNGDFDSAIAIRSLSANDGRLRVQAGAGIVNHSAPEREFYETRHKANTLLEGLRGFGATLPAAEAGEGAEVPA